MGSTISTLAFHATRVNMAQESMIGMLLAVPYFFAFFKEVMDKYHENSGTKVASGGTTEIKNTSSNIQEPLQQLLHSIPEQEEEDVVHLLGYRSLLCGTIPGSAAPDLMPSISEYDSSCPSSEDSVNTVPMANNQTISASHLYDNNNTTSVYHQIEIQAMEMPLVVHIDHSLSNDDSELQHDEEAFDCKTLLLTEQSRITIVPLTSEQQPKKICVSPTSSSASTEPPTEVTSPTSSSVSQSLPVLVSPSPSTTTTTTTNAQAHDRFVSSSTHVVVTPEKVAPSTKPSTEPASTAKYLESISRTLTRKARHETNDHSTKVGIAQALIELGDILVNQHNFKSALSVLKRAESVQKRVVRETMQATASAMAQQCQYYKKRGNNARLAKIYGHMAKELSFTNNNNPSPLVLKRAISLHHDHRPSNMPTATANMSSRNAKEWSSLTLTLDRRLKRASAEAVPLGQILQKQATCYAQR